MQQTPGLVHSCPLFIDVSPFNGSVSTSTSSPSPCCPTMAKPSEWVISLALPLFNCDQLIRYTTDVYSKHLAWLIAALCLYPLLCFNKVIVQALFQRIINHLSSIVILLQIGLSSWLTSSSCLYPGGNGASAFLGNDLICCAKYCLTLLTSFWYILIRTKCPHSTIIKSHLTTLPAMIKCWLLNRIFFNCSHLALISFHMTSSVFSEIHNTLSIAEYPYSFPCIFLS